jgi:putative transposase
MTMNHFKGKQFQQDVIIVAVGYYLRYNLSYREVREILYDRGINVSHTTNLSLGVRIWQTTLSNLEKEK